MIAPVKGREMPQENRVFVGLWSVRWESDGRSGYGAVHIRDPNFYGGDSEFFCHGWFKFDETKLRVHATIGIHNDPQGQRAVEVLMEGAPPALPSNPSAILRELPPIEFSIRDIGNNVFRGKVTVTLAKRQP